MRDAPIDGLIRKSLSAGVRRAPDHYVDENLMAAYLEASLSPQEMSAFEAHVSDCAACQELLAVYMKLQPHKDDDLPNGALSDKKTLFRFSIPIPALGVLLVCVVIAAVFFRFQNKTPESTGKDQVAELQAPVQQPEAQFAEPREKLSQAVSSPAPRTAAPSIAQTGAARMEKQGTSVGSIDMPAARLDKLAEAIPSRLSPPAPVPVSASIAAGVLPAADSILESEQKKEQGAAVSTGTNEWKAATALSDSKAKAETKAGVPAALHDKPSEAALYEALSAAPAAVPEPSKANMLSAADRNPESKPGKDGSAAAPSGADERDAVVSIRTQQPLSRPRIYAVQNRIATSLYTTSSVESTLRFAIKNLDSDIKSAESKAIADRVYIKNSGYWIDKQCTEHADSEIVELAPEAPEYKAILAQYPGLKAIFPVIVYWQGRICVFR